MLRPSHWIGQSKGWIWPTRCISRPPVDRKGWRVFDRSLREGGAADRCAGGAGAVSEDAR